ncbi:unnamed protein product [Alternaria alternata]
MGFMLKPPPDTAGKAWPAIVIGLFVAFGGVLFGYDTGTISGIIAMDYWKKEFSTEPDLSITAAQDSLIVSILSAGTFFGALTAAPFGDLLGRRLGLMVSAGAVFNLGVILQTAATAQPLFIAGRFFAGYGVGLISALIPIYQSETAPKWIRGTIVGAYQLAITIGLLLAAIVNNSTKDRQDSGSYRIPIAVQFLWSIILVGGLFFLPDAEISSRWTNTSRLQAVLASFVACQSTTQLSLRNWARFKRTISTRCRWASLHADCFKGTLGKRLATGCLLQALQQLTGVNFIFYYGTQYFQNAGFRDPFIIQVITNCVNVISNSLLGSSCLGAPVTGEIYPSRHVPSVSRSAATASNWLLNLAIAYSTPYMVDEDHANLQSKVFFVWGSFCFVCIAFVWFMIYETKGLTLEQVDELYGIIGKAWKSKEFYWTCGSVCGDGS